MNTRLLILLFFTFINSMLFAQINGNREISQSVNIVLEEVVNIDMTSSNIQDFVFRTNENYKNGIVQNQASTFTVNSNVAWKVFVSSSQETFIGPEGSTMPLNIFSVKAANGNFQALTNTSSANVLTSGQKGNTQSSGNTFSVDYKAEPGYSHKSGSYQVDLIFTISPQ